MENAKKEFKKTIGVFSDSTEKLANTSNAENISKEFKKAGY